MSQNTKIKKYMITKYNTDCMLGSKITLLNTPEYHHLTFKENGGKETEENGCVIGRLYHLIVHLLAKFEPSIYEHFVQHMQWCKQHNNFEPMEEWKDILLEKLVQYNYRTDYTKDMRYNIKKIKK